MSSESKAQEAGSLFSEFPATSYDDWRQAIDKVLKGAPFEKKLVTKTYEEIDLQPMYRQEDIQDLPHKDSLPGFAPYVRGTGLLGFKLKPWDVCQEIPCRTPAEFNAAVHHDMARGQNAVNLTLDKATLMGQDADRADAEAVGQGGVSISALEDLSEALKGIDLERTPIIIQANMAALPVTAMLAALAEREQKDLNQLRGAIGMDPLGALAQNGALPCSLDRAYDAMSELTAWAEANARQLQTISIQGHPYHNGGASATQELAFALATGVEYLRAMGQRNLEVDDVAPRMRDRKSVV